MDWLFHNPIGEMYGPTFLMVYAVVIALTLAVCHYAARMSAVREDVPAVPSNPDPYEIAYLRGGENEALRLAIFRLMQAGHVQAEGVSVKKLVKVDSPAVNGSNRLDNVSAIEAEVLSYLTAPAEAKQLFASALPSRIHVLCVGYRNDLQQAGLLNGLEATERAHRVFLYGALAVCGLGGYKLVAAVNSGHHNIAFLILMGVIALPILGRVCRPARLSGLGERYLEQLQSAFYGLKTRLPEGETQGETAALTLALFGAGVLAATAYAEFPRMFQQAASTSSCGGGCGSVSSGGSGSGDSGGGGCGGGGCGGGGCGGGCGGCGGG